MLIFPNFIRSKVLSCFATREATRFVPLLVKGKFGHSSKVAKYYDHDCLRNFLFLFMSVPFVKRSHILSEISYIFLKMRSRPNLKVIQCQSLTSVKRPETYLLSKTRFSTVWKAFELAQLSKKLTLKGSAAS